jgi:anhydro-N-acetylmuramic acid kinase
MAWYIGLMSGTSLDGVDAVLAQSDAAGLPVARGHAYVAFDDGLRAELMSLNLSGPNELHRAALAANALALCYASTVERLLQSSGIGAKTVRALGAHGQTVRHRPGEFDGHGYTLQLLNPALLAEITGIDVVCDFRSRDVAAGGQGAPLVPAFHAARFGRSGQDVAVLNLGGIANLTLLPANGVVTGFDCGPGNLLMDAWCGRHLGCPFDAEGRHAKTGSVDPDLLARLMSEPFLSQTPPKSTGRDLFDMCWLDKHLKFSTAGTTDVLATLAEFTALAAAEALRRHAPRTRELLVCGGGAHNHTLMARLTALLQVDRPAPVAVRSTAEVGIPVDQVEALAFAWLATAHLERRSGNIAAATGAKGPRVLGALYPHA